jgi:hypothetical protein
MSRIRDKRARLKRTVLLLVTIVALRCGTERPRSLSDVQTWRMYSADKSSIFEAINLFALRQDFKLIRFDEEAGRILGHTSLVDTVEHRSRVIMMAMAITQMDSIRCVVDARFNFANEQGRYNVRSEQILSAYYDRLFEYLGVQFKLNRKN